MGGIFSKRKGAIERSDLSWLPEDVGYDADGRPIERIVYTNDCDKNSVFQYGDNYVSTGKYTLWSFLPVNLFEQFQRLANAYFLLLLILMCIPSITALNPISTALPLVFVLGLTAIKDGHDDYKRHKSDHQINGREVEVFRGGSWVLVEWSQVVVGDVIRIERDDPVAADCILLDSSEPHGSAFMETAELDGETNLKLRQTIKTTANQLATDDALSRFRAVVVCEPPNVDLHAFSGKMVIDDQMYPLDNDNILLRGMTMRNTAWALGLVVFAGHESKLMMNASGARFKRTQIDELTNVLIIYIFYILCLFCLVSAIGSGLWQSGTGKGFSWYLPEEGTTSSNSVVVGVLAFFSFVILYNTLVPISLYVTVEFIRLGQSWMIDWDLKMYHAETDTPAHVRTTTLNEELGQIEYIFSDKTGTLTQNVMRFLKCSIAGRQYGKGLTEAARAALLRKGMEARESVCMAVDFSANKYHDPDFVFYDQGLFDAARDEEEHVAGFMRLLALCHTVQAQEEKESLKYTAQSPDETALVNAAKNFGYVFKARHQDKVTIEVNGREEHYQLLNVLEFNSDRKRMSVILRCPDGRIRIFCKGADNMVMARCTKDVTMEKDTFQHLEEYATDGLRTLCLAVRVLDDAEYADWNQQFAAAQLALDDRQKKVDAVSELIEKKMMLLGATAIEDRLQQGVPECISNLRKADIKIWVLTGDKQETAINIGFACQLLHNDMQIFIVNDRTKTNVLSTIQALKDQADPKINPVEKALVIDGQALELALEDECRLELLDLATSCKAVICCRVSPIQKADVVRLVKDNKRSVTLAIGDGANDVSMIQAAHIGVGVSGLEGRQAVLASDYSFAQFRFLERLLLVHGRWSYMRMTKFLKYFFYKNFAFTLQQFWFNIYTGWSAQSLFNSFFVTFYNVIFTSLPVAALGVMEKDVNEEWSLRYPSLYIAGQKGLSFSKTKFLVSLLHGVWHSAIIFYFGYLSFGETPISSKGYTGGYEWFSVAMAATTIMVVNLFVALETYCWTIFNHIFTWGSIVSFWVFAFYMYSVPVFISGHESFFGVMTQLTPAPTFWLYMIITCFACIAPLALLKYVQIQYFPTPVDIVREKKHLDVMARHGRGGTTVGSVKSREFSSFRRSNATERGNDEMQLEERDLDTVNRKFPEAL